MSEINTSASVGAEVNVILFQTLSIRDEDERWSEAENGGHNKKLNGVRHAPYHSVWRERTSPMASKHKEANGYESSRGE